MKSRLPWLVILVVAAGAAGWWFLHGGGVSAPTAATPAALTADHRTNPIGIDSASPHLSWQHHLDARNWRQSAYQILVASEASRLREGAADVWDSGRQPSDQSHGIAYAGPALESTRRYYWTVRTWDAEGVASSFAPPAFWEMGLLQSADWQAQWIAGDEAEARADGADIKWI